MHQSTLETLMSILRQGDWNVEMRTGIAVPPQLVPIPSFGYEDGMLFLELTPSQEVRDLFRGRITDGRFEALDERRFEVAIDVDRYWSEDPKDREVREKYLQPLEPRGNGLVFVRDKDAPPGWPLREQEPYGIEEYAGRRLKGHFCLRTPVLAQPATLKVGDVLATGDVVASKVRWHDCGVLVHLRSAAEDHWVVIPKEVPLALNQK